MMLHSGDSSVAYAAPSVSFAARHGHFCDMRKASERHIPPAKSSHYMTAATLALCRISPLIVRTVLNRDTLHSIIPSLSLSKILAIWKQLDHPKSLWPTQD